jgi:hypothetical protein
LHVFLSLRPFFSYIFVSTVHSLFYFSSSFPLVIFVLFASLPCLRCL